MRQFNQSEFSDIYKIASDSLEANIVSLGNSEFLCAGANHFKSLWTRDFCWSIGGLIAIGRQKVAADHVQTLLDARQPKTGNIARIIDTIPSKLRISYAIAAQYLPKKIKHLPIRGTLKPEYKGEHGTYSFDANSLLILGSFLIAESEGYSDFVDKNQKALIEILEFYEPYIKNELIYQEKFGDWQDSVAREGASFYTNILYWWAIYKLNAKFNLNLESKLQRLKSSLLVNFFDQQEGLFKTHLGYSNYSIDGQMIAIESGFCDSTEGEALYKKLKSSPLWRTGNIPGLASFPDYPIHVKSWLTRMVGLNHYHDDMIWSWLAGYSIRVARIMKDHDEAERITRELQKMISRDSLVYEIYSSKKPHPYFRTPFYKSEGPFSWGSGQILQSLVSE